MTPERPDTDELLAIAEAFEWNHARAHAALASPDSWTEDLRSLCATARELRDLPPAIWRTALMSEIDGSETAPGAADSPLTSRGLMNVRIRGMLRPLITTGATMGMALLVQWSVSGLPSSNMVFLGGAFLAGVVAHLGMWHGAVAD